MPDYRFTVVVTAKNKEEAKQVMAERVSYDEDYGFPYQIDWTEES